MIRRAIKSVCMHGNCSLSKRCASCLLTWSRGGIPGVFFSYDISPMKVINKEERAKTFAGFLTGICAVIGGTLTVAAAIDRGVYEGATRIKKLHTR